MRHPTLATLAAALARPTASTPIVLKPDSAGSSVKAAGDFAVTQFQRRQAAEAALGEARAASLRLSLDCEVARLRPGGAERLRELSRAYNEAAKRYEAAHALFLRRDEEFAAAVTDFYKAAGHSAGRR